MLKINNFIVLIINLIIISIILPTYGQNQEVRLQGKPLITNYTAEETNSSPQNWAILKDKRGVMYFGNTDGVLEFDGSAWRIIRVSNSSTVRSLAIDDQGKIFVGAIGEIGYLAPDSLGKLIYISLLNKIDSIERDFKDVWCTYSTPYGIFFATFNKVFIYKNGKFKIYKPNNTIHLLLKVGNDLYTTEWSRGLLKYTKDTFELIKGGEKYANTKVFNMLPFEENKILIGTSNDGLILYDKEKHTHTRFITEADDLFIKYGIYNGINLPNGQFAIALKQGGVVIINKKGQIIDHLNKELGLKNELVRYLFLDESKQQLWMVLNNGIAMAEIGYPARYWDADLGLSESVYDLAFHPSGKNKSDQLWLSSAAKIYKMEEGILHPIENISSQCWTVMSYKPSDNKSNILLAGTNDGLYQIKNDKPELIFEFSNVYTITPSVKYKSRIYLGTKNGMATVEYNKGKWINKGLTKDINYVIRAIYEDKDGSIWIASRYNGLFKIKDSITTHYDTSNGLPGLNLIAFYVFDGSLWFGTNNGLYKFNEKTNRFIIINEFKKNLEVSAMIKQDYNGNLWIRRSNNSLDIYFKKQDGTYVQDSLTLKRLESFITFYPILPVKNGKVWIGGRRELILYDNNQKPDYKQSYNTLIRKIKINDSTIFWGYHLNDQKKNKYIISSYKNNSVRFEYSATYYIRSEAVVYSYFLEGYSNSWSEWSTEKYKEFNNLQEGNYTMHVKAKNIYDVISNEAEYSFRVPSPWYRSILAYLLYFIALGLLIWLIVFLNTKRLKAINTELEETVKERTQNLHKLNDQLEEKQTDLEIKQEEITAQLDFAQEQKKIIENQNKELEKLSIIASETDNAITIMDSQGNFEWFNDAYIKLYEYTLEEFRKAKGKNIKTVSVNKDIDKIIEYCITEKRPVNYESEVIAKSGKEIWTQVTITPIVNEDNNIVKLISIESDIRKLKEYEKDILYKNEELAAQRDSIEKQNGELEKHRKHLDYLVEERTTELEKAKLKAEESDRLKSAFLANMSHEIRTPMNAIVGFSELLTDPDIDPDDKVDLSCRISNNCDSLLRLIDDIIDLAKIESEQLVIEKSEFKISDLINELHRTYNHLKTTLNRENIDIKINIPNEKITLHTDKIRLKQVLTNLLDNALKFTEDGIIEFGYSIEKEYIKFVVKDSGIGLTESQASEIFNRFSKIETNKSNLYRGAGLGLAISKNIVELLGGKIWVESTSGKGSIFQFTLPIK